MLQFSNSFGHSFFLDSILECVSDVSENAAFFTGGVNASEGADLEEFGGEEGDVVVVLLSGAVVCSPREGVWFTHAPTGFVVEGEVKA
jgi:hypothetical protein